MSVILFTGAGASKPFGYPITTEFFNGLNLGDIDKGYGNLFSYLAQELLAGHTPSLDVEDVLSLLQDVGKFFETRAGKFYSRVLAAAIAGDADIHKIAKLTEFLKDRCFDVYGKDPDISKVQGIYSPLIDFLLKRFGRINVFTTNYDLVPESIMESYESSINCYRGFHGITWSKEGYNNKVQLSFYKLHGSTNWIEKQGKIVETPVGEKTHRKHFIIYPGYKDDVENHSDEIFRFTHKEFREKLTHSKAFIVIGFSFRDDSINKIIREVFEEYNAPPNLVYVGPELPANLVDIVPEDKRMHFPGLFGELDIANLLDRPNVI